MTVKEQLFENSDQIKAIAARHGAYDVRVFGSVSRDENHQESDIDLLVKTRDKTSPWFPGGLIAELEDFLGKKVEVVTDNGLNSLIRDRVLAEAAVL